VGGLLRANPVAIDDADGSGTRELAELLGAPIVAEASWPTNGNWQSDLEAAAPLLDAARRAVEDGTRVFVAGSCDLAIATLPALCDAHPGLRVAWFDAHPDFNTPESSNSNFLGGMPLAAACGVWDAGYGGSLDPTRVHLVGIRDVDPGEAQLLEAHHVHEGPPDTGPVYVHLDLDVLDPSLMPAAYAVSGGWTWEELEAALTDIPDLIGIEVTGCAPGHAQRVADTLARL
jgi:arginase/N-omega-hydroxy-L-arginine amidinohydrolase